MLKHGKFKYIYWLKASKNGHRDIVKFLINNNVNLDLNKKDKSGMSPLMYGKKIIQTIQIFKITLDLH